MVDDISYIKDIVYNRCITLFPVVQLQKKIGSSNNSFKINNYRESNQEKKQRIEMQPR